VGVHVVRILTYFLHQVSDTFTRRPNGVTFTAPPATTEFLRKWQPKVGDIVSFKHHGYLLASKKPKLPVIYRMRQDLTWDDVMNSWNERKRVGEGILFSLSLSLSLFLSLFLSLSR